MSTKVIDDIPQITQRSAPEGMMEWFDNKAEELFQDTVVCATCLMKHSSGNRVAAAQLAGFGAFDQLVYDCCCIEAWELAKQKWLDGEF